MTQKEYTPENKVYGTNHEAKVGIYELEPGKYRFRFECVGSHPLSFDEKTGTNGYHIGIDGISLRKLPWGDGHAWLQDYLAKEKVLFELWEKQARQTVAELDKAVKAFKQDWGEYPESLEMLIERPAALNMSWEVHKGHWPYFKGDRIPLDPWGQHYRYQTPGKYNREGFDIWSVRGNSRNPSVWIGNWQDM